MSLPPAPRPGPGIDRLRADLESAAFTVDGVAERLGDVAQRALSRDQALPARRAVADATDPCGVLVDLFILGGQVPRGRVDAALPRTGTAGLLRLGLVEAAGDGRGDPVSATVDLEPHAVEDDGGDRHWWVVSDHGEVALGAGPLPEEHVLGVGTASLTLAEAVIPPARDELAADAGCGSGIQSLYLGRTTARVAASDISPRAVAFTRTTLALNGVAAEVSRGDLFDSLPERVDRLVANLPFVVTPRDAGVPTYTYRDGGGVGDSVSARAVREAPARLARGGIAQFLANWEVADGGRWSEPARGWVEEAATAVAAVSDDVVDAWVVQRELADPALYAEAWIVDGGRPDPATARRWYGAWLDDFDRRGVDAVGFGIVTLRRRAGGVGTAVRRFEDHPRPVPGPWREVLASGLAGVDSLARLGADRDPAGLLPARLHVADGVIERRDHRPGAADPDTIRLVDSRRRGSDIAVSTALAATVGACDGDLSVAAITAAVAALLQEPEVQVRERVLPPLARLVSEGLLVVRA